MARKNCDFSDRQFLFSKEVQNDYFRTGGVFARNSPDVFESKQYEKHVDFKGVFFKPTFEETEM